MRIGRRILRVDTGSASIRCLSAYLLPHVGWTPHRRGDRAQDDHVHAPARRTISRTASQKPIANLVTGRGQLDVLNVSTHAEWGAISTISPLNQPGDRGSATSALVEVESVTRLQTSVRAISGLCCHFWQSRVRPNNWRTGPISQKIPVHFGMGPSHTPASNQQRISPHPSSGIL